MKTPSGENIIVYVIRDKKFLHNLQAYEVNAVDTTYLNLIANYRFTESVYYEKELILGKKIKKEEYLILELASEEEYVIGVGELHSFSVTGQPGCILALTIAGTKSTIEVYKGSVKAAIFDPENLEFVEKKPQKLSEFPFEKLSTYNFLGVKKEK